MKASSPPLLPVFRSHGLVQLLTYLFVSTEDAPQTLSEIARRLALSPSTIQREVDQLERAGIVFTTRVGQARLVHVDPESPYVPELRSLVEKAFGPRQTLAELLSSVRGIEEAYIFGSWAQRYSGEAGGVPEDLDLLVIGDPNPRDVYVVCEEASRRFGIEVNPTLVSVADWNAGESGFLRTIRSRPLIPVMDQSPDILPRAKGHTNLRYVLPSPQGGWMVTKEAARRPSATARTKLEAVRRAKEIVRNSGGGEVRIGRRDGRIHSSEVVRASER